MDNKINNLISDSQPEIEVIEVLGVRVNNLKNIDVTLPRNKLVVITGVSGSGKSSLAFDTICAEGQRRYMESFSAYARHFLGTIERPDIDKVNGLSPIISIEQKTTGRNPRSTVGTSTEIYDLLRLLYARVGEAYSYVSGKKMVKQSKDQILEAIYKKFLGQSITLLAPLVRERKGNYKELLENMYGLGFQYVKIDGKTYSLEKKINLDRYKNHNIELVVDYISIEEVEYDRLKRSIITALKYGKDVVMLERGDNHEVEYYSTVLMDPGTGLSYIEPAPNLFSFNTPIGACPTCRGLGKIEQLDEKALIPNDNKSIHQGAIELLGNHQSSWIFRKIDALFDWFNVSTATPVSEIPQLLYQAILYGTDSIQKQSPDLLENFKGIVSILERGKNKRGKGDKKTNIQVFLKTKECPECKGKRLKKEALSYRINNLNIAQVSSKSLSDLKLWLEDLPASINAHQKVVAEEILKEINKRISFLLDVGLHYLTLNRPVGTLSGGESQRVRLATQIGTQLMGVLYVLDEPSIGLHQRDNEKLIYALTQLRDLGNSVIVVEHDKDMMLASDYILDIGPGAGKHGGRVVAQGAPNDFLRLGSSTADFLNGTRMIEIPLKRRAGNGKSIVLEGCTGNNLKNVTLTLPLGKLVCVTGVSGSGKSTLIHRTLFPILSNHFYHSIKSPMPYKHVTGLKYVNKVVEVSQSPIGRTPRSNPATYIGVFTEVRNLFAMLPEAKIRGYKSGRFSFNVKGGRCEKCEGAGIQLIAMDFLPSVRVFCEVCKGKRYNRETLEIRYKGKSISDVLDMTIDQAVDFFEFYPKILQKIKTLQQVGLGYITLGQHATTLSGGEAQRVKLASELSKKDTGKTLYVLDEPTTGLHFQDIEQLLKVINTLVERGNTVLIIEHNLDIIKVADHIIDMGPEGGSQGGKILVEGTPEEVVKNKLSYTARFLKKELNM